MKAAVWTDERRGPAAVFIPDGPDRPARTASVPGCPPGPFRQWAAKGSGVSWGQWAEHLAGGLPYAGQWSVQEVPDGYSAAQALYHLRAQAQEAGLTQDKPGGTVETAAGGV